MASRPPTPERLFSRADFGESTETPATITGVRDRVVKEILDTEAVYLKALRTLVKEFFIPLRDGKSGVSVDKINLIFSNIEVIYNFHKTFLAGLSSAEQIAEAFMKYAPFLKMYTEYMNGYEHTLSTLQELSSHSKFQNFLKKKQKKFGGDLPSFLIMPVQRIPRYELLLKELIKNTDDDSPEKEVLQTAHKKVREIANHINERKREVENMSRLISIQHQVSGDIDLVQPHRKIVREGSLRSRKPGTKSKKQRAIFLFSDMIMWTDRNHKFKDAMSLINCKVDSVTHSKTSFKITRGNKSSLFQCVSQEERDDWIIEIRKNAEAATKADKDLQHAKEKQKKESREEVRRKLRQHAKRRRSGKSSLRSPLKQMIDRQESLSRKSSTPLDLETLEHSLKELEEEMHQEERRKSESEASQASESVTDDTPQSPSIDEGPEEDQLSDEHDEDHDDSDGDLESDTGLPDLDRIGSTDAQLLQMRLHFIRQVSSRGATSPISPSSMRVRVQDVAEDSQEDGKSFLDLLEQHEIIPTKVMGGGVHHDDEEEDVFGGQKRVVFEVEEKDESSQKTKSPAGPLRRGMTGINEKDLSVSQLKDKYNGK